MSIRDETLGYDFSVGAYFLACSDGTKFPAIPNSEFTYQQAAEWCADKQALNHGFEDMTSLRGCQVMAGKPARFDLFRQQLDYEFLVRGKGKVILVNKNGTSQQCSRCQYWKLELGTTAIKCLGCGYFDDKDVNAARNIQRLTVESLEGRPYCRLVDYLKGFRVKAECEPMLIGEINEHLKKSDMFRIPGNTGETILPLAGYKEIRDHRWVLPPMVSFREALSTVTKEMKGVECLWQYKIPPLALLRKLSLEGKVYGGRQLARRLLRFGYVLDFNKQKHRDMVTGLLWNFVDKSTPSKRCYYFYPLYMPGEARWLAA